MSDSNSWGEKYLLGRVKPLCFGLAAASFGFVLQLYFTKMQAQMHWLPIQCLMVTIPPLFIIGIFSDLLSNHPRYRAKSSAYIVTATQWTISANLVFMMICIRWIDPNLGNSFTVGIILMALFLWRLFMRLDQDDLDKADFKEDQITEEAMDS